MSEFVNTESKAQVPPRPYIPPVLLVMFLVIAAQYCVLYGYLHIPELDSAIDAPAAEFEHISVSTLDFDITADATKTDSGWLVLAQAALPSGTLTKVWLSVSKEFYLGETVRLIGRFVPNDTSDWGVSNRARGIAGRIKVMSVRARKDANGAYGLLIWLRRYLIEQIGPQKSEARALLAGVLCGYRQQAKVLGVEDAFSKTGLSHLIAVSGSHLVVVASLLESLLLSFGCSTRRRYFATVLLTGLYVLFCAFPVSALRSWLMYVITRASALFSRRGNALSALGITGLGMCVFDPYCAADVGFQLSVLSVCALSIFGGYAASLVEFFVPSKIPYWASKTLSPKVALHLQKLGCAVQQSLSAALVCQIATFFCSGVTFGRVSLVAPFANAIVTSFFAPIVSLGLCASALMVVPVIGSVLLWAPLVLTNIVVVVVALLSKLPFASIAVVFPSWFVGAPLVIGSVLYIFWPAPTRKRFLIASGAIMALVLAWFLKVSFFVPPSITVLDVGQGDAILLRDGPTTVLVDAGPKGALTEALARNNIWHIDAVILTHLHDDHTGGLEELVDCVAVEQIVVAQGVASSMSDDLSDVVGELSIERIEEVSAGDSVQVGSFDLECLWPIEKVGGDENEDSLCFLVTCPSGLTEGSAAQTPFKMLLTGDAESDVLEQIELEVGDIDVLKVGHHGSAVSITQEEASTLKPEVSIASAGEGNSYGHPTDECVEVLESSGSRFMCTIDYGDISIVPKGETIEVSYQKYSIM